MLKIIFYLFLFILLHNIYLSLFLHSILCLFLFKIINSNESLIKNINKKKIKKILYSDNSYLGWSQNDNYKSVNSVSLAHEIFDFDLLEINNNNRKKIDLFGVFHSLDHTKNPKKILNFALNCSKLVIVYAHIDKNMNKQHLFSLTEKFLSYLKRKKVYICVLTEKIKKKINSPEIYFLCSKQKKQIANFKKNAFK